MVFLRNKPQAADLLSDSQPVIEDNFNTSDTVFGIDHYQFSDTTGNIGRHKKTTLVSLGNKPTNPAAVPGSFIVYSNTYTPDTTGGTADQQLFGITGNGGVNQFSGNNVVSDGWCWCGGILIQWGTVSFSGNNNHESGTVTLKDRVPGAIPFLNNLFSINATLQVASSTETTASNTIAIRSISSTTFRWVFNSSSSTGSTKFPGFYWVAVGN